MSKDNNLRKQKNSTRLALLAGIVAMGLVATINAGSHMQGAAAQQNSENPMPVDLGCETGAEVCED